MTLQKYFEHYQQAHQNPVNRVCHAIGIPFIIVALILLIFTSHRDTGWLLFAVGWLFQFAGHAFERTWPEFFSNPIYLLIGPLFFINKSFNRQKSKS